MLTLFKMIVVVVVFVGFGAKRVILNFVIEKKIHNPNKYLKFKKKK